MLETNLYLLVYAIDFSKALIIVRQSELFGKYSRVELPNGITRVHIWLVDFYGDHTHGQTPLHGQAVEMSVAACP